MKPSEYLPLVRHVLQFIGGILVAKGLVDNDTANELVTSGSVLVGSAISIATVLWYKFERK